MANPRMMPPALTPAMRQAVWEAQYRHHGASQAEAQALAAKRATDPKQQANDDVAYAGLLAAAPPRCGIYVASRASIPERGALWRSLRSQGWPIVSSWIDEDGPGETADFADLWQRITAEVTGAAGLVLYAEPGDFPMRGVLVEVGMALAAGVPVYVVAPRVPVEGRTMRPLGSWQRHPLVHSAHTVMDAFQAIAPR